MIKKPQKVVEKLRHDPLQWSNFHRRFMMEKSHKASLRMIAAIAIFAALGLTGCQSRPVLRQVASDAPDKPINSHDAADQLKKKYEK